MERRPGRESGLALPYLRAYRHKAFLSQSELAKMAGLASSTISFLENGDSKASRSAIRRLAEALKITPQQLINEDPEIGMTDR